MFSPAGKHESGTKSGGGENWLLRNQFTLKWDLSTHIKVKESSVHVSWCYLWLCSAAGPGMGCKQPPSGQLWQQSTNTSNSDFFHLIVSDVCSYWSLDSIVNHTPRGKLPHPTPPPCFQIGAWNCSENCICFLLHLPPSEAPKPLSFSNMKPWVTWSYLMADSALRRQFLRSLPTGIILCSYDIKLIWPG